MPRHKQLDRPLDWKLRIPSSLARALEARMPKDPITGKVRFGERSAFTIRLYRRWLEENTISLNSFLGEGDE